MARLTGIISKLKGSAGNLTFRRDRGKTLVSEKVTETTNAKTELQLKHRMKWANIIHTYCCSAPQRSRTQPMWCFLKSSEHRD